MSDKDLVAAVRTALGELAAAVKACLDAGLEIECEFSAKDQWYDDDYGPHPRIRDVTAKRPL